MTIEIFDLWSDVKKVNFDSFTENPTLQDGGIVCLPRFGESSYPYPKGGGGQDFQSFLRPCEFHHLPSSPTLLDLKKPTKKCKNMDCNFFVTP